MKREDVMFAVSDTDVLVVGAGPTGLMLAGELLRRGLRVRIVEKASAATTQSRAIGVHARTLEIFDHLGIATELVSRGIPVSGATMRSHEAPILTVDFGELETRYPFILCVSQVDTEAVLMEQLVRAGGAVERGKELVSLAQDASGVLATLRAPTSTGEERVRASWIVGCDGAHSAVRHAVGAEFEGHTYEETFLLADVKLDAAMEPARVTTYLAEDGAVAFFPMKGDRWRVIATAAHRLGDRPTLEQVSELVARRVGRAVPMHDAMWIAPFRIHCRQVERYRYGRVFLAGDAAHIHSPIGGQGMNTGIQDAHNLAWKLALVQSGRAPDALLDSYDAERHAIGRRVLDQTDLVTKVGTVTGALVPLRNLVARVATSFEFVRRQIARDASELTVGYEKSPIVEEHTSSILLARFGTPDGSETPTVASRVGFQSGPKAGARAPDGAVTLAEGSKITRLAELWSKDGFTLLLFDGRSASRAGYDALLAIERRMRERWGDRVTTYIVTPRAGRPQEIPADVAVLLDGGELERRYGAQTECLYLVRPDLYIGFRSQPANGGALESHLASLLV